MADLSEVAGSVARVAGKVKYGLAGETITAGQALRGPETALKKAQCDGAIYEAAFIGYALNGGTVGQPIAYLQHGVINLGCTLTVGASYAVSAAAGKTAPFADITTGKYVTSIGFAQTAANLIVNPTVTGIVVP